jgi:hypothetical protein
VEGFCKYVGMQEETSSVLYPVRQNVWTKQSVYPLQLLLKHMKEITKCYACRVYVVVERFVENLNVGLCGVWCVVCVVCGVWCVCVVCGVYVVWCGVWGVVCVCVCVVCVCVGVVCVWCVCVGVVCVCVGVVCVW